MKTNYYECTRTYETSGTKCFEYLLARILFYFMLHGIIVIQCRSFYITKNYFNTLLYNNASKKLI